MFYSAVRKYHASNTSCVCNRFLESLQSGFYTASQPACLPASTSNPSFSKVGTISPSFRSLGSPVSSSKKPPLLLFLQTGKILTPSASNSKKKSTPLSSLNTSACHFTDLKLATRPGKPPSDGKGLDTLREALALAGLSPPPPPLLLQPQMEGKWRKRRVSDRFVMRFEEGLRCFISLYSFPTKKRGF